MLYIHIPICSSKCYYCDFYSVSKRGVTTAKIVEGLIREIGSRGGEIDYPLRTIYFGGGTPSLLSLDEISRILLAARESFDVSAVEEVTIEVNPEGLTLDYLEGLRELGINRLSMGVQSFRDKRLQEIGRRHSSVEAIEAVGMAREAGFENISIDLMFGFEDHRFEEWQEDIDIALGLGVEHISAYQLSIEPGTLFGRRGVSCASDEQCEALYSYLESRLVGAGYEHYEISSYAKEGFRSRHNSGYWSGRRYVGIGPGAHSYNGSDVRSWNVRSVVDYLAGVESEREELSEDDRHNEYLMTRLRTSDGVDLDEYSELFGGELRLVEGLERDGGRVYISGGEFFRSDYIISSLFRG